MRVKGVSFSCSARAIALPDRERWHEPAPEELTEETTMPVLDGVTKVEPLVLKLIEALRLDGHVVTGQDSNRFKVTAPDGRSALLPARMDSNSALNECRRQLRSVGVFVENKNGKLTWESLNTKFTAGAPTTDKEGNELFKNLFGFELSAGSSYLINQAMSAMRMDLLAHIANEIEKQGPSSQWQTIAEEAERKLSAAKHERDAAVADVVRQRDEARTRAEEAERQLAEVRRSLAGLGTLFNQPQVTS
jgi:hypothetical protein